MNNQKPKISVIMATFNSAATLQRALDSYASQDYPNKELIVIDGASKDETVNIIKKNESFIDYWISEPDSGIYEAWNKALEHVTGEWVQFLGSDDYYLASDVLGRVAKWLGKAQSKTYIAYGPILIVSKTGEPMELFGQPWSKVKNTLEFGMPLPHPGVFHRTTCFAEFGKFKTCFSIAGDYEYIIRILKQSTPEIISNLIICAMTTGGISCRPNSLYTVMLENAEARRLNGLRPWPYNAIKQFIKQRIVGCI